MKETSVKAGGKQFFMPTLQSTFYGPRGFISQKIELFT
jgi:hypothetical protein